MFGAVLHSFILAQVFGLYLIIMAVILLSRVKFYREFIQNLTTNSGGLVTGASVGLMLGILLVVIHNNWVMAPQVFVTIICWYVLIKSILWLSFPERMLAMTKRLFAGKGYYFMVAMMAIMGYILLTEGFYLSIFMIQQS